MLRALDTIELTIDAILESSRSSSLESRVSTRLIAFQRCTIGNSWALIASSRYRSAVFWNRRQSTNGTTKYLARFNFRPRIRVRSVYVDIRNSYFSIYRWYTYLNLITLSCHVATVRLCYFVTSSINPQVTRLRVTFFTQLFINTARHFHFHPPNF